MICPLLSIAAPVGRAQECWKKDCALYYSNPLDDDACAIVYIVKTLEEIQRQIGNLKEGG